MLLDSGGERNWNRGPGGEEGEEEPGLFSFVVILDFSRRM